jgi:Kyakuja-Dileera-Zisupton transposase
LHVKTSTCDSNHDALLCAFTRNKEGHLVSGTGLALCARHALVRKNSVGDLQKGERYAFVSAYCIEAESFTITYCNMDFIVFSALIGCAVLRILITYDIACQWSRNLATRLESYPEDMHIDLDQVDVETAIPSFHIRAHGSKCQQAFALAFFLYVARTAGEEVETGWAYMNVASPSVQEMAPAHRVIE